MDVQQLLKDRGVPFITAGKNVKQGHINIKCPWCGEADPSEHLGIEVATGRFACWRNIQHRGPRLHGLLIKLLGCSWEAANALIADTEDLRTVIDRLQAHPNHPVVEEEDEITSPNLRILERCRQHQRFLQYLRDRGFVENLVPMMVELYDLRCALVGQFKNRIVFPITNFSGKIIGYTGRCVDGGQLRYLSHPGTTTKQHVLWENLLHNGCGRKLYVCEGPFDALKVDFVSRMFDIPNRATCTFGVNYTQAQLDKIVRLSHCFDHTVILFDPTAIQAALQLQRDLSEIHASMAQVPVGVSDPGDLSWDQVKQMQQP